MQTRQEDGSVAKILLEGVDTETPDEPSFSTPEPGTEALDTKLSDSDADETVPALKPDEPTTEVEGATPAAKPDEPTYRAIELPDGTKINVKNNWVTDWMPPALRESHDAVAGQFIGQLKKYKNKEWMLADGKIDYGKVPWQIAIQMGYGNLGKSSRANLGDMWSMVMKPLETIDMLKELANQTALAGAEGLLRSHYPEKTKNWPGLDTPMFDLMVEVYAQNYDLSDDQAGLKRYIIEEPASFLEDIGIIATVFLSGTGFMLKGVQSSGSALKLTNKAKQLLKFNKYYDTSIGKAAGKALDAIDHVWKSTPKLIGDYGKRAYFIGTGVAEGGYPPGFWAKLAHYTLNYMDITGAPFMLAGSTIVGSINIIADPTKKLAISQGEMADMTQKLFEKYHPDFKGDLAGNIGRADAASSYRRSGKPLIFGYDLSDLDPDVNPIRYIPTRDSKPVLSKMNMTMEKIADHQRPDVFEFIRHTHDNRTYTQTQTGVGGGIESHQMINLTDDEIEILKSALPDQHTMIQMRGRGWRLDELPDEVLLYLVDDEIWVLPDIEYIPHIYVGSTDTIDDFKTSTQGLMSGTDTPLTDQIALAQSIEMVENGDLVSIHNMSDEQLAEYGIRKKNNIDEFYNDAIVDYNLNNVDNAEYDESMGKYRQKLKRFQELEKHMAEQGITYDSELDRTFVDRNPTPDLNLNQMIIASSPNRDILNDFEAYLQSSQVRKKLSLAQLPMTTYYRNSGALVDEWADTFEPIAHSPLSRLISEIDNEHSATKYYLSSVSETRNNLEVRLRQLAFSYHNRPQSAAQSVRENLDFYFDDNKFSFENEVSEGMRMQAPMRIRHKIEMLESLMSVQNDNIDVLVKGRQLLNALYLDYFENIEKMVGTSYYGSDVLFNDYFSKSKNVDDALITDHFSMRDEHTLNEAMTHWNSGMDIDEFIDYLNNDSANAWIRQFEMELTDNLHLKEDLDAFVEMQRELKDIKKNAKGARELISASFQGTESTIEKSFIQAINNTELYKYKPLSRQFINHLFFDDADPEKTQRILSNIKPENLPFIQRDIFYELLNRSRKWDGKYLRTANRKEVPFWKHSQDYELGHFLADINKSMIFLDKYGDSKNKEWLGGAKSVYEITTSQPVARFDNRLMTLLNRKYLPSNIIDWILDENPTANLNRGANIYELEDPTPALKLLRETYIKKYRDGEIQEILDSVQEPGTLYYDTTPYIKQKDDHIDNAEDKPTEYHRVWRTGAPGGGLFTTDTLDAAEGFRHDNVARSRELVLLIMEGDEIGKGIPDPTKEHIINPTELIAVAPYEWGEAWKDGGITPIGPALALQIELTKLGGNSWLESIWDTEISEHLTDLAQIYDQWEGYKGSPIPENLNPRHSDEPGSMMELTADEVMQEQKLQSELKTKREKRRRDAEDIVEQVEGIGDKSAPRLADPKPEAMWERTYGIEIECFLDLKDPIAVKDPKDPRADEVLGVTQEASRRTSGALIGQVFPSEEAYTMAYEVTFNGILDNLYFEYEQNARNIAKQMGLTEDQIETFVLEFMDNPNVGSTKMIELHKRLHEIHPDILIEGDGSLQAGNSGKTGVEIKLPIMQGQDQLILVHQVYQLLAEYDYWTNQSAGLHVHIGKSDLTATEIANLAKAHAIYEEAIDTLHAPHRRGNLNVFGYSALDPENRIISNRHTITKNLLREFNDDLAEIDQYISDVFYTWDGTHLQGAFSDANEAKSYVRTYKDAMPEVTVADRTILHSKLVQYEKDIQKKIEEGRKILARGLHVLKYQKLNIYGKNNKTIEYRQAAAAKDSNEAVEQIKFALNFTERFRNKSLRPRKTQPLASELADLDPNRYPNRDSVLKSILDSSDNMPTLKEVQDWDIDPDIWYVLTNSNFKSDVGTVVSAKHTLLDVFDILMDVETDMADSIKVVRGDIQNLGTGDKGGDFTEINVTEVMDEFDVPNYGEEHFDILPDNLPTEVERVERAILFQTKNGGGVDLRGVKINSGYKLAALTQSYRNPRIETTRVFYVKKGTIPGASMEIVGHKGLHLGSPSTTSSSTYYSMVDDMNRMEADGVVLLHNHPDGDPTFSSADRVAAAQFKNLLGTKYIGEIVINSGKFSSEWLIGTKDSGEPWYQLIENEYLDSDHAGWDVDDWELQRRDQGRDPDIGLVYNNKTKVQKGDPLFKPSKDAPKLREIWSKHVPDNVQVQHEDVMEVIMEFGKELKTDHNWITLAMVNNNNELMAIVDYNGLDELPHNELKRVIREQSIKYGGDHVHIFVGEGDWYANDQYVAYKRFFQDENAKFDHEMLHEGGISTFSVAGKEPIEITPETDWPSSQPRHFERRFPQKKERVESGTKFMNDAFTPGSSVSNTLNGFLGAGLMDSDQFSFMELSFNVMGIR